MKRRAYRWILVTLMAALLVAARAAPAGAYTYGDPTREPLAEAYTLFAAAIRGEPGDWQAAEARLAAIEAEARLHFGPCPVERLTGAVRRRDAAAALHAFQELLVLNIARRTWFARESIDRDYQSARTLVAKAFSTYEALSPDVRARDPQLDGGLRAEFDGMLRDLGNPGLFGVGRRPADPAGFDRRRTEVLEALQRLFGIERLQVGHFQPDRSCPEGGDAPPQGGGGPGGGAKPAPSRAGLLWLALIIAAAAAGGYAWWRWIGATDREG